MIKKMSIFLSVFIVTFIISLSNTFASEKIIIPLSDTEEIYDVVLFWGQSNMIGRCGKNAIEITQKDYRLNELGITKFSSLSDVNVNILNNYKTLNHVDVITVPNTLYEYKYIENSDGTTLESLEKITSSTKTIGTDICYKNNLFVARDNNCIVTSEKSSGTNMIPYFGKTYYEKTGHRLIVVYAAIGGKVISRFLPHERNVEEYTKEQEKWTKWNKLYPKSNQLTTSEWDDDRYTYEYMVLAYNRAIKYLENHNMKIGNKFHVAFHGENDVGLVARKIDNKSLRTKNEYKSLIKEVHSNLKKDLNLDFGVVIQTSGTNGTTGLNYVNVIHQAQVEFIEENDDVISGSDLPYRKFIGARNNYSNMSDSEYNRALESAQLNLCISKEKNEINTSNANHYNAAGLSQIGYETAIMAADYTKKADNCETKIDDNIIVDKQTPTPNNNNETITTDDTIVNKPTQEEDTNIWIIIVVIVFAITVLVLLILIAKKVLWNKKTKV